AIQYYRKVRSLYPRSSKNALCQLRMAQVFFNVGRYDTALKYFIPVNDRALDDTFRQILYYYEARAYREQGDMKSAKGLFEKAAAIPTHAEYQVYSYLELGDLLCDGQDFGRAVRYYDDGFTSAGTDALRGVSLYRKGNAQFSAGDYADAAGTFKMLFERYRSHALAPDALGNMLLALYNAALYDRLVEEYAAYQ
ncbi:MAG: tetratricopeptide repeat protein, partial [Candidatus Omnitrophica bacterium]|nr:tetratricopeptide repeat protein [Candidatus Omnitrophota bacterium]